MILLQKERMKKNYFSASEESKKTKDMKQEHCYLTQDTQPETKKKEKEKKKVEKKKTKRDKIEAKIEQNVVEENKAVKLSLDMMFDENITDIQYKNNNYYH